MLYSRDSFLAQMNYELSAEVCNLGNTRKGRGSADSIDSTCGVISERSVLEMIVVMSGAVLMGLEIAGSRVLTPHFGNSKLSHCVSIRQFQIRRLRPALEG